MVFIDRGSSSGVEKGMAVITPDGIVGKVIQSFPVASQVLLITDSTFAAGVISQKNQVHGTLKGQGGPNCLVDYVQNEEKVDKDEWFYTSGDDRVFPKGLPVGQAAVVRQGSRIRRSMSCPAVSRTVSRRSWWFWKACTNRSPTRRKPVPSCTCCRRRPSIPRPPLPIGSAGSGTDADRLLERYKKIGESKGLSTAG